MVKIKKRKSKRGYYFSIDAFIALLVILGIIFFVKPTNIEITEDIKLQEDLLKVLSTLKIGEINNTYVESLISSGNITSLNNSVLEQIGEFYANSDPVGQLLAQDIIDNLNLNENVGIYFNGIEIATTGSSITLAENIWTSRQIISGIQQGNATKGFSSRAFLFAESKVNYFYFGGYVGDGNITVKLNGEIIGANIEGVFSGPFDLYINDAFVNSYTPTADVPYKIDLTSYLHFFNTSNNYIDFKSDENLYIAGGFVRIVYNSSQGASSELKNYFPGVEGIINLYDSFYIPGNLMSMEVFLRYNSFYDIFFNIGNTRIYSGNSSGGDLNLTITDSNLSSLLNYSDLNLKTIPFRLGFENASYLFNYTIDADVFSVTDLSGSMAPSCSGGGFWCCVFSGNFCGSEATCNSCGGTWEDKISQAKQANNAFIDAVLNYSENRVGLVGYADSAPESDYHQLSNDTASLKAKVNSWSAGGGTCICCGINKGKDKLVNESIVDNFRSMVVMSDGQANVECPEQNTGSATQDAIQAACDAYNDHEIKVYAVGFGSSADETTLQSIASCGAGSYYYGDVDELVDLYEQIADEILTAQYVEQTVIAENVNTTLYPESYISLTYNKTFPFGLIITAESDVFGDNISEGSFNVPNNTVPYEVRVVSYSGSKWTDNVTVLNNSTGEWENVFNLSVYNSSYANLGDPYVVNIPTEKIIEGDNYIRVSTGLDPSNSTGGSEYNKIVYSLVKNLSGYSQIVSTAVGCTWIIEFEDSTNTTMDLPEDYPGNETCYYTESLVAYNNNDAISNAIYDLLTQLDLNSNRKIETKFSEHDLTISSVEVTGIPFTWETEVQARVWR